MMLDWNALWIGFGLATGITLAICAVVAYYKSCKEDEGKK